MLALKVCICSNRPHPPQFSGSLAMLMLELGRGTVFQRVGLYLQPFVSGLPQGRQNIITKATADGCSHILWLDDDMEFPRDTAQRLLAHGKSIVGVNYARKQYPLTWTAKNLQGEEFSSEGKTGLEEVSRVGFAVLLTTTAALQEMGPPPHFGMEWLGHGNYSSDDAYFCKKARGAGIAMYVDHDLSHEVGHIGDHVFKGANR